jgi:hypothetical protein
VSFYLIGNEVVFRTGVGVGAVEAESRGRTGEVVREGEKRSGFSLGKGCSPVVLEGSEEGSDGSATSSG